MRTQSKLWISPIWGIGCCFIAALPASYLGRALPVVGAPIFAILMGMLVAPLWIKNSTAQSTLTPGIRFTSKKILQLAVVLLGFGLNLSAIARVGLMSLPIILSTIATALIVAYVFSRFVSLDGAIAVLIGVGSSICGGSAIAATAPVIQAKDEDIAQAISVIFLFNVIAALIFPSLGDALGLSNEGFALFAGTAINDTSSVTAAALAWDGVHGSNSLDMATIVKLTRTLAIIPITLVLGLVVSRRQQQSAKGGEVKGKSRAKLPIFIVLFLLASLITTIFGLSAELIGVLKAMSKYGIVMAMFAIGLNTNLAKLIKSGSKPIVLGLSCWVSIAVVSLAMQRILTQF